MRVLFKPHPGTGTDDPEFGEEVERLKAMVEAAGPPHEVVTGAEGLYAAFNRADLLVSDISSVITDFLASGKPYVVTSSSGEDPQRFRATFPSAAGAYILGGDGSDIARFVEDARTVDTYAAERDRTARYLLGDFESDLVSRFDRAIDEAVEAASARAAAQHIA
jgi:CDP-glycerol glycerophosphotransferase (TagB/SpsB family)